MKIFLKYFKYIDILLIGGLLLFIYYIFCFSGLFYFGFVGFIYGSIFYFFHILWYYIRHKERKNYIEYMKLFFIKGLRILSIFIFILYLFFYYHISINPALMPTYILSNGDKILVFQSMTHIASKDFYEKIKNDLIDKKKQGYVYYFEGVRPGTKESHNKFNEILGVNFNKDLYKNISNLYGLVEQDNRIYLGLINNKDYNVDIDMDTIINLYKKNSNINNDTNNNDNKKILELADNFDFYIERLSKNQRDSLIFINKSILNIIIKNDEIRDFISSNFLDDVLFKVILEERNKFVSEKIINTNDKKIFITYGLMHFDGIFNLLRQNDHNWHIIDIKYLKPID